MSGVEVAMRMPGVQEVVVKVHPGDLVRPAKRNGDRLGHILAVADDPFVASRRAESAVHEIEVTTVPETVAARSRPIADSVQELIGGTPLVRLRLPDLPTDITALAKLEMANPLSTSKDRAALYMIEGAERRGELVPGAGTIVEASSGNTGISLAALAAARGYRCVIVLPDSATLERRQILRTLGAEVVLTPRAAGYRGAIAKAQEVQLATPGAWVPCQHENADNVRAHYETTGPEIWADTEGRIDVLVCGVGTGGTLTGIARYLKERNPAIRVVAVEPEGSPVLSGGPGGLHGIPGLNGGFVAATTDVSSIDEIVVVSDAEATSTARLLSRTAGLLVGISSGAAARACQRIAPTLQPGATVVTVLPDTGERYLSLWQDEQAEAATGAESGGRSLVVGATLDEAEVAAR